MKNSILNMSGLAIALDRAKSDIIHVTHAGDDGSQNNARILLKGSIGPFEENKQCVMLILKILSMN